MAERRLRRSTKRKCYTVEDMRRFIRGLFKAWCLGTILAITATGAIVYADPYGRGAYGECEHSVGCSDAVSTTVVATKRGLEIAINLVNGQVITTGTYPVKVTPLNGQGQSFVKVEFYVDGKLLQTSRPDSTGTANWTWDTTKYLGSRIVKVIIYDTDDSTVIKEFRVTVSRNQPTLPTPAGSATPPPAPSNPIEQATQFLEDTVRSLPTPVVRSIPYILLAALLMILLLALVQLRRELIELRRRTLALKRSQQLIDEKSEFIGLTSHYLRTPLAIMQGGADLLGLAQPPLDSGLLQRLKFSVGDLSKAVELLLNKAASGLEAQNVATVMTTETTKAHAWRAKLFLIPTLSAALLLAFFDYIAVRADKLTLDVTTAGTQISLFAVLTAGLFIVVRGHQLQQRDRLRSEQQAGQQAVIDEARNNIIRAGADTLNKKLLAVAAITSPLPESKAKKITLDGQNRIGEVLRRFRDTATVIPPVTSMPFQPFTLNDILLHAQNSISETMQAKHITMDSTGLDAQLASQQPDWIAQIITTLIDNAVAFSPENSSIEVAATTEDSSATITVRDHGAGIPLDKQAKLFQPFTKVEGAEQFDHPGLGLSLYLDHLLITGLGGDIHIESQPQRGTAVTLTFPTQ